MIKPKILRLPQVIEMTGLSRSLIYLYCKDNKFPKPIKIGDRASGWITSEVEAWIDWRISISRDGMIIGDGVEA